MMEAIDPQVSKHLEALRRVEFELVAVALNDHEDGHEARMQRLALGELEDS